MMTTRISKQQILDELKNAGVEIPANASFARLRELYETTVTVNVCKDGKEASAALSLEYPAENAKTEASGSSQKSYAKTEADGVKSNVFGKRDASAEVQCAVKNIVVPTQNVIMKRHELLKLQQAITELENSNPRQPESEQVSSPFAAMGRMSFHDIEHAIVKFDGENRAYSVYDFIHNFERVMNMVAAEEVFKYTSLCNSLTGTAKLLLNKTDVISYAQLKEALIKEFGRTINRGKIYKIIANYKWNKKDNIRRYVLEMENIASRCNDIDEFELIGFIIDGMQDNSPESYLLMNARTMDHFKESLDLYEQRRANRSAINRDVTQSKSKMLPTKLVESTFAASDTTEIRCYNCTQMGHYQSKCPYDRRPNASCFRCWQMGHDHRSCTNPKKLLLPRKKEVAAVNADETAATDDAYGNFIKTVNNSD